MPANTTGSIGITVGHFAIEILRFQAHYFTMMICIRSWEISVSNVVAHDQY